MKYIISGTNRPGSNTLKVSKYIQNIYQQQGENIEIIDLAQVGAHVLDGTQYGTELAEPLKSYADKIMKSDGIVVVCPEYNGSMPGILKYFIDHLKYPDAFEFRPVCFIGLGGMFGGLRPVEHLQQVFGYRNAFIYPVRVFMMNVFKMMKDGQVTDPIIADLLVQQAKGFSHFVRALQNEQIDANAHNARRPPKK